MGPNLGEAKFLVKDHEMAGLTQQVEEGSKDTLGHAPENAHLETIGGTDGRGAGGSLIHRPVGAGSEEAIEWQPPGVGHLFVEDGGDHRRKGEDERADEDAGEHHSARGEIVEDADDRSGVQIHAHLLPCLPPRGRGKIGIRLAPAAARQRQLTRPAVVFPLGAANEQNAVGVGGEDDGDGGAGPVRIALEARRPRGEPGRELGNPAQWSGPWQAPPQQPSPGGGPRRLQSEGFPEVTAGAGTERRRSTAPDPQPGQLTMVSLRTSSSKALPQSRHP